MMDVDGSGSIDADELLAAMDLIGLKSSKAELLELINSVDVNRSGSMELAEFLELMTKHILVAEVKASNDFKVSMMIRRPVVLDTFPLVARSFDVHTTVDNCIGPKVGVSSRRLLKHSKSMMATAATFSAAGTTGVAAKIAARAAAMAKMAAATKAAEATEAAEGEEVAAARAEERSAEAAHEEESRRVEAVRLERERRERRLARYGQV